MEKEFSNVFELLMHNSQVKYFEDGLDLMDPGDFRSEGEVILNREIKEERKTTTFRNLEIETGFDKRPSFLTEFSFNGEDEMKMHGVVKKRNKYLFYPGIDNTKDHIFSYLKSQKWKIEKQNEYISYVPLRNCTVYFLKLFNKKTNRPEGTIEYKINLNNDLYIQRTIWFDITTDPATYSCL